MRSLVRVGVALIAIAAIATVAASCSAVRPSALTVNGNDISRDSVDRELSAIADNPSLKNEIAATEGTIKSGGSAIWLTHVVTQEVVDREVHRRGIRVTTDDRRAGQAQAANFFGPQALAAFPKWFRDQAVGEFSRPDVIGLALNAGVKKLALFHHDPSHTDEMMDRYIAECRSFVAKSGKELDVFGAQEGMVLPL